MEEPKIDIVLPFVNGLDPEWQKIHSQYRDDIDYTRFDGHDILKYVFRSIDRYVPWINTVHLLVMQDSQVPEWIDRDKVHIVYHKDFIPEQHLPIFTVLLLRCIYVIFLICLSISYISMTI